jgi:hypothetical protein
MVGNWVEQKVSEMVVKMDVYLVEKKADEMVAWWVVDLVEERVAK